MTGTNRCVIGAQVWFVKLRSCAIICDASTATFPVCEITNFVCGGMGRGVKVLSDICLTVSMRGRVRGDGISSLITPLSPELTAPQKLLHQPPESNKDLHLLCICALSFSLSLSLCVCPSILRDISVA